MSKLVYKFVLISADLLGLGCKIGSIILTWNMKEKTRITQHWGLIWWK